MRVDPGDSPSTRSGTSMPGEGSPGEPGLPPARDDDAAYEPESDEEEEESFSRFVDADDSSRASSNVSEAAEDIPLADLVDLSDRSKVCLVRMHKRVGNVQIPCVCGLDPSVCSIRNHSSKRESNNPTVLGMPGFYVEYVSPDGTRTGAGRADMRFYSAEEVEFARARLQSERTQVEQDVQEEDDAESLAPSAPSVAPSAAFSTPRHRGAMVGFSEPLVEPSLPSTRSDPTPKTRNPLPKKVSNVVEGPSPVPLPSDPNLWYCFVQTDGRRIATDSTKKVLEFQGLGYDLRLVVPTREEAVRWCHESPAGVPNVPVPGPGIVSGPNLKTTLTPNGSMAPPARSGPTVKPQDALLSRIAQMSVGKDPSESTQHVYGISPADEVKMDDFLLPPGLTDPDSKADFYDLAMDVASLPGGYRLNDDDDLTNNEALLAAIGKGRNNHFRSWRRNAHNQLGKIASKEDLLKFVTDVERTVIRTRTAQNQRMRKFLYACSHDSTFVELYVSSGPLPRLVEDTYRAFLALLEALRSAMFEFHEDSWKGSYIQRMLHHHSRELGHIRATSSDYRMHLLETYVYLRNSQKEKFQDPSFVRSLMYTIGKERTTEGGGDSGEAGEQPTRCSHCRRNGTHKGTTKESCPLKMLSRAKATSAVNNLSKQNAKKVTKAIASAMEENPDGNVDEVISAARAEIKA